MNEILDLLSRYNELTDSELARLNELLGDLASLADDQLAEVEEALIAAYDAARNADAPDVEACRSLVEHLGSVRTEAETRIEQAATRDQQLSDLDSQVHGDQTGDGEGDPDPDGQTQTEPASTDDGGEPEGGQGDGDGQAQAAPARTQPRDLEPATQNRRRPTLAQLAQQRPGDVDVREETRPTIRAAGDIPGFSAGSQIDPERFGHAVADKIHSLLRSQGARGRYDIASVEVDYPEELTLRQGEPTDNREKIDAVLASIEGMDMDSIVASGGLCAPRDVRYELFGVGDDRRPIRDGFVRFQADRGGLTFIRPPELEDINTDTDGTFASDDDTAVVLWTEATDSDPGSNVKPSQTITCGTEVTEDVDAITKRLLVGNFDRRFFPEQFAEWWRLAGIAHARVAETQLWDRAIADAESVDVTTGQVLGAARDILENLDQAAVAMRSRHRTPRDAPVEVILPDWVPGLIRADLLRQHPGDSTYDVSEAQILGWLRARNVNPVFTPDTDQEFGSQTAGALLAWPLSVEMLMYFPGTFLFLDGGALNFGMDIRDSDNLDTNDVEAFMETFEAVAQVGVEALHITSTICPSGESAAAIDIDPCTSGS